MSVKSAEKPRQTDTSKKVVSTQTMHASARKTAMGANQHTSRPSTRRTSYIVDVRRPIVGKQEVAAKSSASRKEENSQISSHETAKRRTGVERNYPSLSKRWGDTLAHIKQKTCTRETAYKAIAVLGCITSPLVRDLPDIKQRYRLSWPESALVSYVQSKKDTEEGFVLNQLQKLNYPWKVFAQRRKKS